MDYPLDGSPSNQELIKAKMSGTLTVEGPHPTPCDHCWHPVPINQYSSWGTLSEEVCCHCGTRRNLHGPYAPSPYQGFQIKTAIYDG